MHMNYSQIMSPRPPLPRKVGGGHDPPAPMGAPPLLSRTHRVVTDTARPKKNVFRYVLVLQEMQLLLTKCAEARAYSAFNAFHCILRLKRHSDNKF